MIPVLIITMKATTKPYIPCVAGRIFRTRALPNFEGSSDITPATASPQNPTAFALPHPGRITARAAPSTARDAGWKRMFVTNSQMFIF